jgi:hypothetical protein
MTSVPVTRPPRRATPLLPLLISLYLAACGGGEDPSTPTAQSTAMASRVTATLLHDDGSVMPSDPNAMPIDLAARTQAGRYATEAQAEQLEHALRMQAISTHVESGHDADAAVDSAVLSAQRKQAELALDDDAPVLVRGADVRLAARVADRLQAGGFRRVFLVSP